MGIQLENSSFECIEGYYSGMISFYLIEKEDRICKDILWAS